MNNFKLLGWIGTVLTLSSCAALQPRSDAQAPATQPVKENLIGLFIVKRNNLNQQYRGEVYPIAKYSNGRYTDASLDVTLGMRQDSQEAEIVKRNAAKSVLNSKPTFTFANQNNSGRFSVDRLGVGQFACSTLLIGRGNLVGQINAETVFNQLPRDRERQLSGFFNQQEFNETWRSTIAAQTTTPTTTQVRPTRDQLSQYRTDLLRMGTTEIAKNPQAKLVQGSVVITDVQVFDLDGDGKPEVFGKLRKAPPKPGQIPRDRPTVTSIYANIWLSYAALQPKLLASQVTPYYVPAAEVGRAYEVLGTIDANGDGKQEVLIQNNGYELINFSIYELQGNQLRSVFTGAGYGC
jgi:hypothetical protein